MKYSGMERVPGTAKVNVCGEFWWMFRSRMDPLRKIFPEEDGRKFLDDLNELHGDPTLGPESGDERLQHGVISMCHAKTHHPLVCGQTFVIHCDSEADAEKMKAMLEFQWACIGIAAMSGGAEPEDFDPEKDDEDAAPSIMTSSTKGAETTDVQPSSSDDTKGKGVAGSSDDNKEDASRKRGD